MNDYTIIIDGAIASQTDLDGTTGATIATDTSEGGLSYSNGWTVSGAVFDIIKTKILDAANPCVETVSVSILDKCCDNAVIFEGVIRGANVKYCEGDCEATVEITAHDPEAAAITCLKNTLIHDRVSGDGAITSFGEDEFRVGRYTPYCDELRPDWLQKLIIIYARILSIIVLLILGPLIIGLTNLIIVINVIIDIINFLNPGDDIEEFAPFGISGYSDVKDLFDTIASFITSCGRKHKTPFFHSYLSNIAKLCGLTLKSSLFDPGGKLHNLMRFDAPNQRGARQASEIESRFLINRPNITGYEFLNLLSELNIEWRVRDGVLCVERKDFFNNSTDAWIDLREYPRECRSKICYSFADETPCALALYEYGEDAIDVVGNEARNLYSGVLDWNTPPSAAQAGVCRKTLAYGAARFRNDCIEDDCLSDLEFLFPNAISGSENYLLMEKGTASLPKLLMWDGVNTPVNCALIQRTLLSANCWNYNEMVWIRPTISTNDNFYNCFYFLDNPRLSGIQKRNFSVTLEYDCELYGNYKQGDYIILPDGTSARVDRVAFSLDGRTVIIEGRV